MDPLYNGNDQLTQLTHTLAAMTDMNGKLKMQTAVYRWAVANHSALDTLGLVHSLIKACEEELNQEPKCP